VCYFRNRVRQSVVEMMTGLMLPTRKPTPVLVTPGGD
jgi:hypothetical protein